MEAVDLTQKRIKQLLAGNFSNKNTSNKGVQNNFLVGAAGFEPATN